MARNYPEYDYDLAEAILEAMEPYRAEGIINMAGGNSGVGPGPVEFRNAGLKAGMAAVDAGDKHRDRTAEMIEMVAEKTGMKFPSIVQRYLEIWILCTGLSAKWQIMQVNPAGFVYEVKQCTLKERAGIDLPQSGDPPCAGYCLGALEAMADKVGIDLAVKRESLDQAKGLCRFSITPR